MQICFRKGVFLNTYNQGIKMDNCALNIQHVTKEYKLYENELDRLKEAFHPFKKSYHKNFFALKDICIQIEKGEKVGIIGANGAGKSTLLKIITGVLTPTQGEIKTHGRIAALLELGAGFNQDYTGIENIRLNGTLMGDSERRINEKMQQIIDFADIGDFIYQPVKSYSSGMFVRLAFATQIFSEPDILIVDEALSVGDIRFQQKCYRAMDSIMKDKTVVLVTHDTAAVTRFCKRVIWINQGTVMYDGEVAEGLKQYQEFLINQAIEEKEKIGANDFDIPALEKKAGKADQMITVPDIASDVHFKGNGKAKIYQCGLYDNQERLIEEIEPRQLVKCIVRISYKEKIIHPILGLAVRDRLGNEIIGINSETLAQELPPAYDRQEYWLSFIMPELNKGEYTVSIAVANGYQADHVQLCWLDDALIFRVCDRKYDIPGTLYIENGSVKVFQL